jgi:hypothetical protein
MKNQATFFLIVGMLWTILLIYLTTMSSIPLTEVEKSDLFNALDIGMMMTCTGVLISAMYKVVEAIKAK